MKMFDSHSLFFVGVGWVRERIYEYDNECAHINTL